jgi:signal transduction histidine kinase
MKLLQRKRDADAPRVRLPGVGRTVAVALAVAVIVTLVEASGLHISGSRGVTHTPFLQLAASIFPVWLIHALLSPIVVTVVLSRQEMHWRSVAALHLGTAAVYAVLHLGLVLVYFQLWWRASAISGINAPVSPQSLSAHALGVADMFFFEMLVYMAVAGGLEAWVNHRRAELSNQSSLELRAAVSEAQLQALRYQLQPHFLFNVLNSVDSLIRQGLQDSALRTIAELSSLLRRMLTMPATDFTSVADEIGFLRRYLAIEHLRYGSRLDVDFHIAQECESAEIPIFVLQPLVENAMKHGFGYASAYELKLVVRVQCNGDSLQMSVEDNGSGLPAGWTLDGGANIGLKNIRTRLEHLYSGQASLEVATVDKNTVATIKLPLGMRRRGRRENRSRTIHASKHDLDTFD